MSPSILLTGSQGQLGQELQRSLLPIGRVHATDRTMVDLAETAAIEKILDRLNPSIIVNAAAYTAVDRAESEPQVADRINHQAPACVAAWAARHRALLIHYSTDYVYDGTLQGRPYREDDAPAPINVYGASKLAGDRAIADSGCTHLIFRTSWVYGLHGQNFMKTMLSLMAKRESIKVIADQYGSPTSTRLIADVTALAIQEILKLGEPDPIGISGTYHLQSSGETSWFRYAQFILQHLMSRDKAGSASIPCREIVAITSSEYPTVARRPANSRLDCTKLERTFNLSLPDWKIPLGLSLNELAEYTSE